MRFLAFFFALSAHASDGSSAAWHALLHFEGGISSAAPGEPFFLSSDGHKKPEAEFEATLRLFRESPNEAACRFPARALYLKRMGYPSAEPDCERFQKWRKAIDPRGMELVFAAAFINSPSSMYGHTLLKFSRGGKTEGHELLDYTLNFGAETGDAGGFTYVWLGLTGGFPGYFSTAPFYLKVKEYNFVENRDFWIYPLQLTEDELELLLRHAWELREVRFPYFFLRKNCSYFLLEYLEVARPGAKLTDSFPYWAVPVDTIRLLQSGAWLGEPSFRPSRHKQLQARRSLLGPEEEEALGGILASGEFSGRSPLMLDAAYELLRYRTEGKAIDQAVLERALLEERAKHPDARAALHFQETPPERGHLTGRLSLAAGRNREHAYGEITYRGTLHDLLSDPLGYEDFSELSMGDLRARWEAGRVFLERADILRLRSLPPREALIPRTAWGFKAGFARAKELPCSDWRCVFGGLEGGTGIAGRLGPILGFLLLELDLEAGGVFQKDSRFMGGGTLGLWSPLWRGARALAETEFRWRLLGDRRTPRQLRLGASQTFGRNLELRLRGEKNRGYREADLGAYFYF